jgi:hypothetical protein
LWLSETFDGHVHDKKIAGEQPLLLPSGITLWQDTGFIGHSPGNVTVKMPTKKPKGKDLSEKQNSKTAKFPLSELQSNTPLAVSNAVVFSGSVSDIINTVSTIRLC